VKTAAIYKILGLSNSCRDEAFSDGAIKQKRKWLHFFETPIKLYQI
jgi:hypothetical protein